MIAKYFMSGLAAVALVLGMVNGAAAAAQAPQPDASPLIHLGVGDTIAVRVYGQSDMDGTETIGDDGSVNLALIGHIQVAGLSPGEAAERIEKAFKAHQILVDPHVTISVVQSRSQRVSILGEVHSPGFYSIDSKTTVLDLLVQAGGLTENSASAGYIVRPDSQGNPHRYAITFKGLGSADEISIARPLQPGDAIFVPKAEVYYIYGEVGTPGMFRLESGMTVIQAIARAGGVTPRGSDRRLEIKRKDKDGTVNTRKAKPEDTVQADDVIRVKERIF